MTAIAEKLRKAGVEPWQVDLDKALALAVNQGATQEQVLARVRAAYELSGEGRFEVAGKGHVGGANARQPNGDGSGHYVAADGGPALDARPSPTERSAGGHTRASAQADRHMPTDAAPHREGAGQRSSAGKAIADMPAPREPSKAQRNAAAEARKASAKAVLDLGWIGDATIPAGPHYIDLRVGDLPGMIERQLHEGATHARSAVALELIKREVDAAGVADPAMKWVDILPPDTVKEISRATESETLRPLAVGWLRNLNETAGSMIEGGRVDA